MGEECLFCKIVRGEIPAKKVGEDDRFLAFHDIAPQAPTHILVIPKEHIASLDAVTPDQAPLIGELLRFAADLARAEGLVQGGYRSVINTGAGAGQSVFHLHCHILGGRPMRWPPG